MNSKAVDFATVSDQDTGMHCQVSPSPTPFVSHSLHENPKRVKDSPLSCEELPLSTTAGFTGVSPGP